MTLDGLTAVQARIAQIQQLVAGIASGASPLGAAPASSASSTASSTASGATTAQSPEFASLLADAMGSGASTTDPLSSAAVDAGGTAGATSSGGMSTLSQLLQLSQQLSGTQSGTTGAVGTGVAPGVTGGASGVTNPVTRQFLTNALAEQGKPYVYGATASITDPDPKAFDCSELTKWAAARAGTTIPDGATAQYLYIRDHGGTMTVQQALHTPGALLFHFSHEPRDLGDIPADGHVAISLGDGVHTIEARGHAYGTNVFDNAAGRDFDFAGMIPGMS